MNESQELRAWLVLALLSTIGILLGLTLTANALSN